MTRPASSAQIAAAVSRRAHISSGTIPPPPTRRAFQVSTQPLQSRSRTGLLPLRSREPNAPHLPEVTTYPHPEEEDPEEIPQATATAAAEDAEFDHEDSVILHPTDQGGAERTCRTTQEHHRESATLLERRQGVPDPQRQAEPPVIPTATVQVAVAPGFRRSQTEWSGSPPH